MRPVYLTAKATAGASAPCVLDQYLTPIDVMLNIQLFGNTGGGSSYTVQYSNDDPFASYATDYNTNATWYDHPTLAAIGSSDGVDKLDVPARAVRLYTNTAGTGGTATPSLVVIQAGVR